MTEMPTTEETEEPELRRLSHSQLKEYAECGERYRLTRMIRPRPPDRPAGWLVLGLAIHEAIEKWELSGRQIDIIAQYYESFDRIFEELKESQPDLSLWLKPFRTRTVEIHIENERKKGAEQLVRFVEFVADNEWTLVEDEETSTPLVEVPLDFELDGVRIVGYVDEIMDHPEGRLGVVDVKSGNKVKSNLQLGIYKIGLSRQYGIEVDGGFFLYTKTGELSPEVDLSRYTEDYISDLFSALERGVQNNVFIPNPGDHCGLCPVKRLCRELGDQPVPLDWESVEEPWWAPPEESD